MSSRGASVQPFVGKSAMDSLLRRIAWSKTSVGSPQHWPGTWRAAVRLGLDSSFPMVVLLGEEFLFVYNDACIPLVGGKHPEVLAKPTATAWAEIWEHPIEPMVRHVMATGEPAGSEDLFLPLQRHGYAEETHFVLAFSAIRDDAGEKPSAVFVQVRETTERVLIARQIECLDALSARCFPAETAEEACAVAAEAMTRYPRDLPFTLLYLVDRDGLTARLTAHSGLTACPDDIVPPAIPWDVDPAAGAWTTVAQQLHPYLRDAMFAPQTALTIPLADPGGGSAGLLIAGVNPMRPLEEGHKFTAAVAERLTTAVANAKVKQQSRERAEALAALDRAKTLFLSDVSHEFRTPLTLLLSPLDEVLARRSLAAADRELLETARRAATRLLKLVQSLLDFSRVEAGRAQACFEPTDLSAVTADLVSLFRSAFERARVALIVDCPPLPESVYVDRDMWEKIVLNLVSNAFKFTLAGEVRVRLAAHEGWVELEVKDTGCGVAPEDLPHIFERFRRGTTSRARTAEGSGIGLSLVQELVKLHGGTITLASEADRGATVTVRLRCGSQHLPAQPIGRARKPAAAAGAAPFIEEVAGWVADLDEDAGTSPRHTSARGRSRAARPNRSGIAQQPAAERILVVDDNADMRRYLHRILKERWTVTTASDGMQALARVRASPPDLLILDLMMPGLDGLSLLGALRDDPKTAELPVMVLSARSNEEASIESLSAGADDYLPKPFSARELVARAAVQLARSRLRQAERLAREAAEQQSLLKDDLVAVFSRALRNPINAMLGALTLLQDRAAGAEEIRRALELIVASTREQHRLIDEIHDVSLIAAGCFEIEPRKRIASLAPLVTAEVDAVRLIAAGKRVRLESFVDSDSGPLEGDAGRLQQAVRNLLIHAVTCTPPGGNILVECHSRGTFAELVVRDNGVGITADALPQLFDPLWVIQRSRTEGSSAATLGLAVAHRIVELHEGRIFVESEGESRGAAFTVHLPLSVASTTLHRPPPAIAEREDYFGS